MRKAGEEGLVAILVGYAPLDALVDGRVTMDDQEQNIDRPAVTLRVLGSRFPAGHMRGSGDICQSLVEVTARAHSGTEASLVADLVADAFKPYEQGEMTVQTSSGSVRFGSILPEDRAQAPSIQQESYRKVLTLSVTHYE